MNLKTSVAALSLLVLLGMFMVFQPAHAQKHRRDTLLGKEHSLPNLTPDQKSKLKTLRLNLKKESLPLRNQIREKEARLKTLETAPKSDLPAIHATLGEIHDLRLKMARLRASTKQEIRGLLTEEQRILFDTRNNGKKGRKNGSDAKRHRGEG